MTLPWKDIISELRLEPDEGAGWAGPLAGPADGGDQPVMRWRTRLLHSGSALRTRVSSADTVLFWHHGTTAQVLTEGGAVLAVLGGPEDPRNLRQCTVPAGVRHTIRSGSGEPLLWSEAVLPGLASWTFTDVEVPAPAEDHRPEIAANSTIEQFELTEHIEGGYYRQLWESGRTVRLDRGERTLANTILYLLDRKSPIGRLHLNAADITHFAHGAEKVDYLMVAPDGTIHQQRLGLDVTKGELPAFTVPGGWWKASSLPEGQDEALISEIAAPGFVFEDQRLARVQDVPALFPGHVDRVLPYAFG